MGIVEIVTMLSGLALFLFGMNMMGDGLEKAAGEKLQEIIKSLTGNVFKGVFVGAVVTGIIQSSSATTVMVVGFVNAGIMTLPQAAAVIMGANIGTTATAYILSLGNIDISFMQFFKPAFLAPLAIILGVILPMFSKKQKIGNLGTIILGFGLLFTGMETMSDILGNLKDYPWFRDLFVKCESPLTGVVAGTFVTAAIQSSSASVGILQALSDSGSITFAAAIPIIFGQNIGTCVTAMLSGLGATKNAKKAALIHLYFNIIGSLICLLLYSMPFLSELRQIAAANVIDRAGIANVHCIFNIANTLMLLPFIKGLIYLANITIGTDTPSATEPTSFLDERLLTAPSIALAQCTSEIARMFRLSIENIELSRQAVVNSDMKVIETLDENENAIDNLEVQLNNFLMRITDKDITDYESKVVSGLFHTITDIERVSDRAKNMAEAARENLSKNYDFSQNALKELDLMFTAVKDLLEQTYEAFINNDVETASRIEPCEEVIDMFNQTLRNKHIDRLKAQKCSVRPGVNFIDIISNLERVGDHCNNISLTVIRQNSEDLGFDHHSYQKLVQTAPDTMYNKNFADFEEKYFKALL